MLTTRLENIQSFFISGYKLGTNLKGGSMGNNIYADLVKFVVVGRDGVEKAPKYGYKAYDDFGKYYCNNMTEQEMLALTDKTMLAELLDTATEFSEGLQCALEHMGGFYFDGKWVKVKKGANGKLIVCAQKP
jgi:hypothetical protein